MHHILKGAAELSLSYPQQFFLLPLVHGCLSSFSAHLSLSLPSASYCTLTVNKHLYPGPCQGSASRKCKYKGTQKQ